MSSRIADNSGISRGSYGVSCVSLAGKPIAMTEFLLLSDRPIGGQKGNCGI